MWQWLKNLFNPTFTIAIRGDSLQELFVPYGAVLTVEPDSDLIIITAPREHWDNIYSILSTRIPTVDRLGKFKFRSNRPPIKRNLPDWF